MSRWPLAMLVISLGAIGAWPLEAVPDHCAEIASGANGDFEILRAYIDPGMAGFIVVVVLGFLSSIGYMARDYFGRAKRWLLGSRRTTDADADDEADADSDDDGEGERC